MSDERQPTHNPPHLRRLQAVSVPGVPPSGCFVKTHRERAERAADLVGAPSPSSVALIARETQPTELVEAAQALLDRTEGIVLDDKGEDDRLARDEERLRAALALYPEEG